jgi:hypothetical protein
MPANVTKAFADLVSSYDGTSSDAHCGARNSSR